MTSVARAVAAVVGLLAVTALAWGADLPPPPVAAPAAYNWSGLYIGLNAGYANAKVTETVSGGGGSGSANLPAGLGGFQIGSQCTRPAPSCWGFEADFAGNMATKSVTVAGGAVSGTAQIPWLATLRGRVGYAFDRLPALRDGGRRGHRAQFHRQCRRHRLLQHDQHAWCVDGRRRP